MDIQVQEVQRVPNKMNSKRPIPKHIELKCKKLKIRRISKAATEKQLVS